MTQIALETRTRVHSATATRYVTRRDGDILEALTNELDRLVSQVAGRLAAAGCTQSINVTHQITEILGAHLITVTGVGVADGS